MRIVCWQTILMKYHTFFIQKLGNMSQNVPSAAVIIVALRANQKLANHKCNKQTSLLFAFIYYANK